MEKCKSKGYANESSILYILKELDKVSVLKQNFIILYS